MTGFLNFLGNREECYFVVLAPYQNSVNTNVNVRQRLFPFFYQSCLLPPLSLPPLPPRRLLFSQTSFPVIGRPAGRVAFQGRAGWGSSFFAQQYDNNAESQVLLHTTSPMTHLFYPFSSVNFIQTGYVYKILRDCSLQKSILV